MLNILRRIKHFLEKFVPDKIYLKYLFKKRLGKKLNLKNPVTYNEKLQWLKLYDRKLEYCKMVDKYEVKDYVKSLIGEQYIIPTLGLWKTFEEIDFSKLPNKFVLKCTHDSGGLVICQNKDDLDLNEAKKKINKCLKNNFYYHSREWPYKFVEPRIIAEPYIEDVKDKELRDYKFFCFSGEPKYLFIATGRNAATETCFDFFDMDFNHLDIKNGHPCAKETPHKPEKFEEMKRLAAILSKDIPHVRVDFYEVNGKVLFGELTFYHWGGLVKFEPDYWDKTFGDLIILPN